MKKETKDKSTLLIIIFFIISIMLIGFSYATSCNTICQDKVLANTDCCIITPASPAITYEIYDQNLNLVDSGTPDLLSAMSNEHFILFNQPVGYYHVILSDNTATYITVSNNTDSPGIMYTTIILLSLIIIVLFYLALRLNMSLLMFLSGFFTILLGISLIYYNFSSIIYIITFCISSIIIVLGIKQG